MPIILTWMRLTLGLGVFMVPFYIKDFGMSLGLAIVMICGLLNHYTMGIIYKAAEEFKKPSYPEIVDKILGKQIGNIF